MQQQQVVAPVRGEIEVCDLQGLGLSDTQIKRLKREALKIKQVDRVDIKRGFFFATLDMGDLAGQALADTARNVVRKLQTLALDLSTTSHAKKSRSARRRARRR
jgi:hypothetical protein